jgi:hypothetical protein
VLSGFGIVLSSFSGVVISSPLMVSVRLASFDIFNVTLRDLLLTAAVFSTSSTTWRWRAFVGLLRVRGAGILSGGGSTSSGSGSNVPTFSRASLVVGEVRGGSSSEVSESLGCSPSMAWGANFELFEITFLIVVAAIANWGGECWGSSDECNKGG